MIVGFIVALPIDLIVGLFWGSAGMLVGRYLTAAIIAFGVLAAVAQFYVAGRVPGIAGRALGAVGRMALSCYVLQNALAGALCYGWGLGLAQRMGPGTVVPGTIGVYALVVAVLMAFSKLWLSRWERGPLEMLWQASYQRLTTRR